MSNFVYDGTFEGLLTCIYEAYYTKQFPNNITGSQNLQESLVDQNIYIHTDTVKAKKVYDSVRKKISPTSLEKIYYTYLSELEDSEIWILEYLKLGFKMGPKIDNHLADERVLRVHKSSLKVLSEKHRILGLLRFQEIYEEIFYGAIETDHNILRLIIPHFKRRFPEQNWIIHDTRRGLAAVYDKNTCIINKTEFHGSFLTTEVESDYRIMWKKYFDSIVIKNRTNPKLQRRCMPARYWKHLVEMQPD